MLQRAEPSVEKAGVPPQPFATVLSAWEQAVGLLLVRNAWSDVLHVMVPSLKQL